ncbi:P-loop NTPase fold protein [Arthrobacter sp. JCM 19049]|uniref:P-loop NTPase fold protein n=1 Tax=Arthrobacter sp. JCM 19049 TaxID=1460643 RepID=UPI000AAB8955
MRSRRNLLNTLLSKATGSREVALVVSGASGAGKSWLLRQLQHELGAHPHVLLRISPWKQTGRCPH